MKKLLYIPIILVSAMISSCQLDIAPSNSLTGEQMTNSPTGIQDILNGCYATFKDYQDGQSSNSWYLRQYFQMSDFASDDIVYGHETSDNLNMIFRYEERDATLENCTTFWINSYKIIYAANVAIDVIEKIKPEERTAEQNFLLGEAQFIKAYAMHSLVRLYALPYSVDPNCLGIIIRENSADASPKARATVKETYNSIVELLLNAEENMIAGESERSNNKWFASIGAVQAMLSRVYLYMEMNNEAITYANKVIELGDYSLTPASNYENYFKTAYNQDETIWCIRMLSTDNRNSGAISSMIQHDDGCWGEEGYSPDLLSDMGQGTELEQDDVRWVFVQEPYLKNGLTLFPCRKLGGQDGSPTCISPVLIRLSEVYFNRAEAYAKLGKDELALSDINEVRKHRMLDNVDEHLWTAADAAAAGSMLNLVLKEKRIELSFETFRFFDLTRNKIDIIRNYWGFHTNYLAGASTAGKPGLDAPGVSTKYNYYRLFWPVPNQEIVNNDLCLQNVGY